MMNSFINELITRHKLQIEYLGKNKPVDCIEPVVSVCVATYQHAPYIRECIEGILMQETDFPYEIIIGEDESTDGTREICIDYANKHPDKIRLFLRDRNISQYYDATGNFIGRFNGHWNRMSARGKYISYCEGDDYWIDPLKLQKQVEILNKNPLVSLVFTERIVKTETNYYDKYPKTYYSKKDLLGGVVLGLQTICFRKNAIDELDYHDLESNINGDILIPYLCSLKGNIICLHEATAVYRITGFGVASSRNKNEKLRISLNHFWNFHSHFGFPSRKLLVKAQTKYIVLEFLNNVIKEKRFSFYGIKMFYELNKSLLDYIYFIFYIFSTFSTIMIIKIMSVVQSNVKRLNRKAKYTNE